MKAKLTVLEQKMNGMNYVDFDDKGIPVYIGIEAEQDDHGGWFGGSFFIDGYFWPWLHDYKVWKRKNDTCYVDPIDWDDLPF